MRRGAAGQPAPLQNGKWVLSGTHGYSRGVLGYSSKPTHLRQPPHNGKWGLRFVGLRCARYGPHWLEAKRERRAEAEALPRRSLTTPRRPAHRHVSTRARARRRRRGETPCERACARDGARVCAGAYGCARGGVGAAPAEVAGARSRLKAETFYLALSAGRTCVHATEGAQHGGRGRGLSGGCLLLRGLRSTRGYLGVLEGT